jgi:hypothetical protein
VVLGDLVNMRKAKSHTLLEKDEGTPNKHQISGLWRIHKMKSPPRKHPNPAAGHQKNRKLAILPPFLNGVDGVLRKAKLLQLKQSRCRIRQSPPLRQSVPRSHLLLLVRPNFGERLPSKSLKPHKLLSLLWRLLNRLYWTSFKI